MAILAMKPFAIEQEDIEAGGRRRGPPADLLKELRSAACGGGQRRFCRLP